MFNVLDFDDDKAPILPKGHDMKVKKSLNFNDAASIDSSSNSSFPDKVSALDESARKRQQDEVFGSLSDDDELSGKCNFYYGIDSSFTKSNNLPLFRCQSQ